MVEPPRIALCVGITPHGRTLQVRTLAQPVNLAPPVLWLILIPVLKTLSSTYPHHSVMDKVTIEDANLPAANAKTWQCRRFIWAKLAPLYRIVPSEEILESSSETSAACDLVGLKVAVMKFRRDGEALRQYSIENYTGVSGI